MKHANILTLGMVAAILLSPNAIAYDDRDVAYVEEISIFADGTESVRRYTPGEDVNYIPVTPPIAPPEPRRRGVNQNERFEMNRLEDEYQQGRMSESEYSRRMREIYKSTFVDSPPEDTLLEKTRRF